MYCQTMFGVSREVMLIGLQTMEAEKLTHYDIHCPKCRRANRVERKKLELANPNWQEALKQMVKEAAKVEKEQVTAAKVEKPKAVPKKVAVTAKEPAVKSKATPKASTTKKPVAKKTTSRAKGR
jgi:hypothetical protein